MGPSPDGPSPDGYADEIITSTLKLSFFLMYAVRALAVDASKLNRVVHWWDPVYDDGLRPPKQRSSSHWDRGRLENVEISTCHRVVEVTSKRTPGLGRRWRQRQWRRRWRNKARTGDKK